MREGNTDMIQQLYSRPKSTNDTLERLKRESLREQAMNAAWQMGALARRAEHEAPEVHRRLRDVEASLRALCDRLAHPPGAMVDDPGELPVMPRLGELF